jgi:hypothetical protein
MTSIVFLCVANSARATREEVADVVQLGTPGDQVLELVLV